MKNLKNRFISTTLITLLILMTLSCKNDCPTSINDDEQEELVDEFYVRYILDGPVTVGSTPPGETTIRIKDNTTQTFSLQSLGKWEVTIGPVLEGFEALLTAKATQETYNRLSIIAEIHVSKNNGPFALKAIDSSDSPRDNATISYLID